MIYMSLISCQQLKKDIDVVPIEEAQKDDLSFLDKIEIIPLKTNSNSLIKSIKRLQYVKELNEFLVLDSRQIFFRFDDNGNFISSSLTKRGEGPDNYLMAIDVKYNSYSQCFESYDPSGAGYVNRYNLGFDKIQQLSLSQNQDTYNTMTILNDSLYLFTPIFYSDELERYVCIYKNVNKNLKMEKVYYNNYIANIHMITSPCFFLDDGAYFTPPCLDYHFYRIDTQNYNLIPILKLDFGANTVLKKNLDDRFGQASAHSNNEKAVKESHQIIVDKNNFLLESDYLLPIVRLMSEDFIYAFIINKDQYYNFIFNRNTKRGYLLSNSFFKMSFGSCLDGNVMYTYIDACDIDDYIDERYISEKNLDGLKNIKDDDNPVVIKYYFKK